MPVGVIVNTASIALGGIAGVFLGKKMPPKLKENLILISGVCALGMGISSIILMKNMPAVIFSVIIGTVLGFLLKFGTLINKGAVQMQKMIAPFFHNENAEVSQEEFLSTLVTIIVLFCASGTGIYGSIDSGMTGDHTILISKSILDFFTAAIFACNLGAVVSVIAIPQFVIFLLLFLAGGVIYPLTTPDMIADFKACGGFLLLATGFRIMKVKDFPVADMILAMVLAMPLSWLWVNCIMPLL